MMSATNWAKSVLRSGLLPVIVVRPEGGLCLVPLKLSGPFKTAALSESPVFRGYVACAAARKCAEICDE